MTWLPAAAFWLAVGFAIGLQVGQVVAMAGG